MTGLYLGWLSTCGKLAPNAGYLLKIPDCAQSQEVYVLNSLWEPIGACGLQRRIDGRPHKYCSDNELGSDEKCETDPHYFGTYRILQKVYQKLCPDHPANGKIVK